jgi:hypothetical protein
MIALLYSLAETGTRRSLIHAPCRANVNADCWIETPPDKPLAPTGVSTRLTGGRMLRRLGDGAASGGHPVPYQSVADAIAADWRAVERDLEVVQAGTPEAERLHAEAERLLFEYQALLEEARQDDRAALPPLTRMTSPR